jgi:nucleoside-diphosphate-sugar epimerase
MSNDRKVLIVGNLGYVGSEVCKFLQKNSIDIYGIDTNWFGSEELLNEINLYVKKQWVRDIRDALHDKEIWNKNYDAVIYLAAVSNDPMGKRFANVTHKINAEFCFKTAEVAKSHGIKKLVFASSCSMYGASDSNFPSESDELSPMTEYAESKVWAEKKLASISDHHFQCIALRFATACGPSSNLRLDLVLNDLVASAIKNKKVEVLSDGTPWRPLIHVKDMSRAILWAINYIPYEAFLPINVGSKEFTYQVKDFARLVSEALPGTSLTIATKKAIDSRSYKVNFSLYEELAGIEYYPKFDAGRAIQDLIRFIKEIDIPENFRASEKWMRLKTLESKIDKNLLDEDLNWINKK